MRLKSPIFAFCLAIATFAIAVSCSAPQVSQPNTNSGTTSSLKVAMIASGAKDDGSWSQSGYEGLQLIKEEYNAEVDFQGPVAVEDAAGILRNYIESDYDFVIAHSGGYIEPAEQVAAEFPRSKIAIVTTYAGNNKNLGAVAFRSGEAGYLAGVLTAMTTQTNQVAYLVGYDYPVYKEEEALFRKGVTDTNPNIEITTEFLQTWTDHEKGKAVATQLADAGYDSFAINADEAGIGAIAALSERDDISIVGWTNDQYELAPNHIVTSVLQDIPDLVLNAADLMQQGRWEGKLYKFGLKEGIYDFAPFRGALTLEQEAEFNAVKEKVMSGEIDISAPQI